MVTNRPDDGSYSLDDNERLVRLDDVVATQRDDVSRSRDRDANSLCMVRQSRNPRR
jgi:hypothetical protein